MSIEIKNKPVPENYEMNKSFFVSRNKQTFNEIKCISKNAMTGALSGATTGLKFYALGLSVITAGMAQQVSGTLEKSMLFGAGVLGTLTYANNIPNIEKLGLIEVRGLAVASAAAITSVALVSTLVAGSLISKEQVEFVATAADLSPKVVIGAGIAGIALGIMTGTGAILGATVQVVDGVVKRRSSFIKE